MGHVAQKRNLDLIRHVLKNIMIATGFKLGVIILQTLPETHGNVAPRPLLAWQYCSIMQMRFEMRHFHFPSAVENCCHFWRNYAKAFSLQNK